MRQCPETGQAIVSICDMDTDEEVEVRLPWEHRDHPITWGKRERLRWGDRWGVETANGPAGVRAIDHEGKRHLLPHAAITRWTRAEPMRKAEEGAAKGVAGHKVKQQTGDRWITIHPHGDDEKGVPVLIRPNPDGTHRVIGGGGGAFTHLRLDNVAPDTPENRDKWKAKAKDRKAAKAEKETARKAGQSPEDNAAEETSKREVKDAERAAERAFVEKVRSTAGGVDEDLKPENLSRFKSDGARNLEVARHHRRQYQQAIARTRELAQQKVDQKLTETERRVAIDQVIEDDPVLAQKVRDLSEAEIDLQQAEDLERANDRRLARSRTSATRNVADQAAEQARAVLDDAVDPTNDLGNLGGRVEDKERQVMAVDRLPSEEVNRRSLQTKQDALILHKKANGEELQPLETKIAEQIAERHKVDLTDEDAVRREAARQLRRSEILKSQSDKLKRMEGDGDVTQAMAALAFCDRLKGIADDAHVARQLGLTVADETPLAEPELAAISELMDDSAKLREAKKQFKQMMGEIDQGNYDVSRRAFDLKVEAPPDAVIETEADLARRAVTERILGIADPKREAHVQAVADGHYLTLAEVGLAIGKSRYLDRPTIDAIGAKNAAVLNRWALEGDGHDSKTMLKAIEDIHVGQMIETTQRAIVRAEAFVPELKITATDVGSIEQAIATLDVHEQALDEAQREVGGALGRMEALATQAQAMRQPMPSHIEIQARDQWDNALQWVHAAGLAPGDYEIDRKNKTVRIPQSSWSKLVHREGPEVVRTRERVDAIKAGKHDESGWLPPGFVRREANTFNRDVLGAGRFWQPLDLPESPGGSEERGYTKALEDHVGSRIADGEVPGEILKDMNSAAIMAGVTDVGGYTAALRDVFPIKGPDGELQPLEAHKDYYQKLAEEHVARTHPGDAPLHAQSIDLADKDVQEAVFRTLAKEPRLKLAHLPISAMTHEDRRTLRGYFYERMGIDPKKGYADEFKAEMAKLGPEPSKTSGTASMFGPADAGPSAEWKQWAADTLRTAQKYPAEGKEHALRALGERPAEKRSPRVTDAVATKLDQLQEEHPNASPTEHATRARAALAPDLGEPQKAAVQAAVDRQMQVEQQRWLERNPNGTATDAATALKDRAAQVHDWETAKARAAGGPPLQAADVHGYIAPRLHDAAAEQIKGWSKNASPWSTYVEQHGGLDDAMGALQDELKGQFAQAFNGHHGDMKGAQLRTGKTPITNRERHIFATGTPEEQAKYREQRAKDLKAIQSRDAIGKYQDMGGAGTLLRKETEEREKDRHAAQQQGGMFSQAAKPKAQQKAPTIALDPGERWTLGDRTEAQLRSVMPVIGAQIGAASSGAHLFPDANMHGDRIHQQRSVKQFDENGGRIGLFGGTGFGKTPVMFGMATTAIAKGESPHGALFIVPSKVQAQFDGELNTFLEPGKYRWQTGEDKGHEDRVAMLKDPSLHMRVMTHQAYMRTAQKIVADHHGWEPGEVGKKLGAMDAHTAAKAYREAFDAHGIPPMFTAVDEAHMITHRDSTEWGGMHALARAGTHPTNATHAVFATATPNKNDASELSSMASLVDPHRYADRDAFMAAFGGRGIEQNPDSIRRELSHLTYSAAIPPKGVERTDLENVTVDPKTGQKVSSPKGLPLHPEHQKLVDEVDQAFAAASKANKEGRVDVEAIKRLSPESRFAGIPEDQHEAVAKSVAPHIGILRDTAMRRAIELAPAEINTKLLAMTDVIQHDTAHGEWTDSHTGEKHQGKTSIVFANSAAAVRLIQAHLKAQGIRAETITGATTADEMRATLAKFPKPGRGGTKQADVLIGTSSIEAGLNAQFAQSTHHFDVPMTEKSFNQRSGRAYRQGQRAGVENHSWHTDTRYDRDARVRLQRKTGLANVFQTNTPHLDDTGIAAAYERAQAERHQGTEPEAAMAAK